MTGAAVSLPTRRRPSTAALVRTTGFVAMAVAVAAGVLIALAGAAADHVFLVPALKRAFAGYVAGPLAPYGIVTPLHVVFAEVAVMTVAYAVVVACASRIPLWWIGAAVLVLHVAFLLAPPMLSTDVFNYIDVARLGGLYHVDPYVVHPAARRHDAVYVFVHWRHTVTDYGPLFTLAVRPLGRVSVAEALWVFKALAALAGLGCTALIGWIAHRRGGSAARAVAAFGLNPVLLVWTVAGAHNDLLMLLALLAGVALVLSDRLAAAGAALVAATAIKLSAGLVIPFLVLRRAPGRLRLLAGLVVAAALVVAISVVAFPDHALGMFAKLQRQEALVDIGSVPLGLAYAAGFARIVPRELQVLHVLLAAWIAGWLVYVARGGDALAAAGWALLGVIVTSSWLLPWYLVWPLALAAATDRRRLLVATCAVGASYAIGHAPLA
ncbi:MAG: glycosyltransferase 87 family protein [Solirubrobacteraceae bacterium]